MGRVEQDGDRLPDRFFRRVSEHPLGAAVPAQDRAVHVPGENRIVRCVDNRLKQRVLLIPARVSQRFQLGFQFADARPQSFRFIGWGIF